MAGKALSLQRHVDTGEKGPLKMVAPGNASIQFKREHAVNYVRQHDDVWRWLKDYGVENRTSISKEDVKNYLMSDESIEHRMALLNEWNRGHDSESAYFIEHTFTPGPSSTGTTPAVVAPQVATSVSARPARVMAAPPAAVLSTPKKKAPLSLFHPTSPAGQGFDDVQKVPGGHALSLPLDNGEIIKIPGMTLAYRSQLHAEQFMQSALYSPLKSEAPTKLRKEHPKSVMPPRVHVIESGRDIVKLANQQLRYSSAPQISVTTTVANAASYRMLKRFHMTNMLVSVFGSSDAPAYDEIAATVGDEEAFADGILQVLQGQGTDDIILSEEERTAMLHLIGILQSETNRGLAAPVELYKAMTLLKAGSIDINEVIGSNQQSLFWAAAKKGGAKAIRDILQAMRSIKLAAAQVNVAYFEHQLAGRTFKTKKEALDAVRIEEARARDPFTVEGKISELVRLQIIKALKQLRYQKTSDENDREELCAQVAEEGFKDKTGQDVNAKDIRMLADKYLSE
ncbi:hypothetical protein CK934_01050 [Chitinophaga sp. MD30]|nr:hypothetical protein CK934_01050 [Chitinophaga sp. MD30]